MPAATAAAAIQDRPKHRSGSLLSHMLGHETERRRAPKRRMSLGDPLDRRKTRERMEPEGNRRYGIRHALVEDTAPRKFFDTHGRVGRDGTSAMVSCSPAARVLAPVATALPNDGTIEEIRDILVRIEAKLD